MCFIRCIRRIQNIFNKKYNNFILIYKMNGDFIIEYHPICNNIFRKETNNIGEIKICQLLKNNPHTNIITIYDITKNHIDMELLNIDIDNININEIKKVMKDVKTYMHTLGIIYIDWKLDNIGIDNNGQLKLFDFNVSGLININTNEWIIEPPKYWSYNKAINNGMKTAIDIDNYAFNIGFE